MSTSPKRYLVYWDDTQVLDIVDEPGPLVSKLAPPFPPGEEPAMHPFLSATAFVPQHEGTLRAILDQSQSLADYLTRLQQLGYRVVEVPK